MISQHRIPLSRVIPIAAAVTLLAIGACADLPSTPEELQQSAARSAELHSAAATVLAYAEAHLLADPAPRPAVDRALRLTRLARHELEAGDPARALRRALYVLQLLRGHGMQSTEPDSGAACAPATCPP